MLSAVAWHAPTLDSTAALVPGLALMAVALAAWSAWVLIGTSWPSRLRGAGVVPVRRHQVGQSSPGTRGASGRLAVSRWHVLGVAVLVTWTVLMGGVTPVVLGLVASGALLALSWRARRARRVSTHQRRQAVIEACGGLTASLRGGTTAEGALVRVVSEYPSLDRLLEPAVSAARMGGDVPAALTRAAATPGADGLRRLAACWQVAAVNGAALADTLERLTSGLREDEAHRREVEAQLAGPRATARLLAALPGLGLALGSAMGAQPLSFLVGTGLGQACLVTGCCLVAAGLLWIGRLAASAELTW